MAQTIKLKRSAVASKVPLTTDVALGELAINTFDGKIYFKKDSGTASIVRLANIGEVVTLTGDQTIAGNKIFSGNGSSPYGFTNFYTAINTYPPGTTFSFLSGTGIQTQQIWLGTNATTYSLLNEAAIFTTGKMSQNGSPSATGDLVPLGYLNTQLAAKANTSHTHAAGDIISGTIATARLGSGTANSTTFLRGDNTWATVSGSGTVTSVDFNTGTTGLTVTGSPITSSGTITLAGTLAVANGGTGATSAATALTNLGAAADSAVVKLTGNQTIAGVKTFSSDGYFNSIRIGAGPGGSNNLVIGNNAGASLTAGTAPAGNENIAIGNFALDAQTTGYYNTAIGYNALSAITTNFRCTAVGWNALANTTGDRNTGVGASALASNTTGTFNVAVGNNALALNTTGANNMAIGNGALNNSTTAGNNTAIGTGALLGLTTTPADGNVGIGNSAGRYLSDGTTLATQMSSCVYIGAGIRASANNETNAIVLGANQTSSGSNTTRIGTTATTNTIIPAGTLTVSAGDGSFNGVRVGRGGANDSTNTCVSSTSMLTTSHGGQNTAVGVGALGSGNFSGGTNTAIGLNAALQNTSGSQNTAIGVGALQNNTTGAANIALGWAAGVVQANGSSFLETAQGCVYIGAEARGLNNSDSNSVVIAGRTATARGVGEGANTTVIGNAETTKTTLFGRIHPKPTGTNNVVIGNENTARALSSSNSNIFAIGADAMQNPTANTLGSNNMALGTGAMYWHGSVSSPGTENVAIGNSALQFASTGQRNLALGALALTGVTTGSSNVGVGFYSLLALTTGGDNVGIGSQACGSLTTGGGNVCIGAISLGATNGSSNVAIGTHAGWKQTDGSTDATGLNNCVFIGNAARSNGNNQTNQIVIGDTALGEGSNTTVIGKAATTSTKLFGKTTSQTNTATTNAVVHGLRTEHQSTGTPATGIGTGIEFAAETAANNTEVGATIEAVTTDVTAASEDFDLVFKLMAGGAAVAEKFRITSTGNTTMQGNTLRIVGSRTPASATATGTAGEICWDASYIYVCTATNTWKRVAISTW